MRRREIKRADGSLIRIREPGSLERLRIAQLWKAARVDPNADELNLDVLEERELAIKTALLCIEEPRFYADLRPLERLFADPLPVPAGCIPYDLTDGELAEIVVQIGSWASETEERLDPLSGTATG